ncbi:MAG: ABC transporter ATP-binding protein [candidate division Zixibacteria bacterium]|nr:ABC transporter ATP-binding protein [candidate division Zixibacteria bacterium]MBU1469765.1 ABC transporter ATP-binding protein [candidate division Zixibacteria bacterium]MBU2624973.1 ABC transporter ATP-binding protein [candidate division Zixibacteria bacterium]
MHGLTKTYTRSRRHVHALRDISLRIDAGSFVAVTGSSGSGKTTLLLSLGGLIQPTEGQVKYGDQDLYTLPTSRLAAFRNRTIGFVLQTFNLVPYLTAVENVILPMLPHRGNGTDPKQRAVELLDMLGLADRRDFLPRELSVGQQQRVAIARALGNEPDVILADEPTGNLDPSLADEILDVLEDLNMNRGKTVVLVTHSPQAAARAGIVLKLREGMLVS